MLRSCSSPTIPEELGRLVHEGRMHEFRDYAAFVDPAQRDESRTARPRRPSSTCKLDWSEREREPHAAILRLYQTLLQLRRTEPALRSSRPASFEAVALDVDSLALRRDAVSGPSLWAVTRFKGAGTVSLRDLPSAQGRRWELVLTTEDSAFASDAAPPRVDLGGDAPTVEFNGPATVFLRAFRQ